MFPLFLNDVSISYAPVPLVLDGATNCGVLWQASFGKFMLAVPQVARYLVENGTSLTIDQAEADDSVIVRFANMTPLAALLYQRDTLAFHAASVVHEKYGAIILAGDSGCGKSTLMMTLLQRGWSMQADELTIVSLDSNQQLMIHASSSEAALWPTAIEQSGRESRGLVCADANRLLHPLVSQCCTSPQPLRSIFWLNVQNEAVITLSTLTGTHNFSAMSALLYNSHVAGVLLDRAVYMRYASSIMSAYPIKRLSRPRGIWSADDLADRIEKELQ